MSTKKTTIPEGQLDFDQLNNFQFDLPTNEGFEEEGEAERIKAEADAEAEKLRLAAEGGLGKSTEELEIEKQGVADAEAEAERIRIEAEAGAPENKGLPSSEYGDLVSTFLESGEWEDVEIEKEDGTTVKLSEDSTLTREEFLAVRAEQNTFKKEALEKDYLKVDTKDEDKKRLANIVLQGGNLKEIFQDEGALQKPFAAELGWDLEDENHQASIVYQQYVNQGIPDKRARILVEADREDLILDSKAKEIVEKYQSEYSKNIADKETELLESNRAEADKLKVYKKELSAIYKEQGLEDSFARRFVRAATERGEDGELIIDSLYETKMKDPKEAQEIIMFLEDRDKYLQLKMHESKKGATVSTLRKVNIIPNRNKKEAADDKNSTGDFAFNLPTK